MQEFNLKLEGLFKICNTSFAIWIIFPLFQTLDFGLKNFTFLQKLSTVMISLKYHFFFLKI